MQNVGFITGGQKYNYDSISTSATGKSVATAEKINTNTKKTELEYYKELCGSYKNISFRLEDREVGITKEYYLGYNGSMNQIGNNFGASGQCSISIDVAVIRRMQADPGYEAQVKGMIESSRKNYSTYESDALKDGFPYICVSIEDDGGRPVNAIAQHRLPFSTEEEVKSLWNDEKDAQKVLYRFKKLENDLLDSFMSLVEKNRLKTAEVHDTVVNDIMEADDESRKWDTNTMAGIQE